MNSTPKAGKYPSCIALAQIKSFPGQIKQNTERILDALSEARQQGAQLVVFPELVIPSYAALDLFFQEEYLQANIAALEKIKTHTKNITAVVGFADWDKEKKRAGDRPCIYNAVAVLQDGRQLGVQRKFLLPNYNIFFEERYFQNAQDAHAFPSPFGKLGCQICEDLWALDYPLNPSAELQKLGAEIILNSSASPFHVNKLPIRQDTARETAKILGLSLVYVNLVGCYDGFEGEVLFDGRSFAVNTQGELLAQAAFFEEEILCFDPCASPIPPLPALSESQEIHKALVHGIREYFSRIQKSGPKIRALVGISGGIDSALILALAVQALGAEHVLAVTMPSEFSSQETLADAKQVCRNLGVHCYELPITDAHHMLTNNIETSMGQKLQAAVTAENIQSRVRMLFLMAFANEMNGIVLNTGNKTELALNNCTIYGDMVGGVSVLGDLDKDRIYALTEVVNASFSNPPIPQSTISRVPSAELRENQVDATVMGAEPVLIAPLVRAIVEEQLSVQEAKRRFSKQFGNELIERSFQRLDAAEWKRRQAAPSFRVTPLAFGMGRRIPIGHGWKW